MEAHDAFLVTLLFLWAVSVLALFFFTVDADLGTQFLVGTVCGAVGGVAAARLAVALFGRGR